MIGIEKSKADRTAEVESYFSTNAEETWLRIAPVLASEARVYEGPAVRDWLNPLPLDLLQSFAERFPHELCEKILSAALSDANPKIAAYALMGLEMIESVVLKELTPQVLSRTETIETVLGCFVQSITLGDFAAEKQSVYLEFDDDRKNR